MSASATRGTFNVEVSRIGVSISPSSFTCVEPASLPKPLPTNTAPATFSRNLFREKVAGAVFVGNGFGKLAGSTQVNELGEIETPILLTSTLNVPRVADALIDYMLALPGNEDVRSINPVVAETNDGYLNDIRGRHVGNAEVWAAIEGAKGGPVVEGAVGAGTGTVAFGF